MTLTKYQRGDPMEGWNDFPSGMISKLNDSSVSLGSRHSSLSENTSKLNPPPYSGDIVPLIEEICQYPTQLQPRTMAQLKLKLLNLAAKLTPNHKQFIVDIGQQLKLNEIGSLKQDIVSFMMINDGVSSWCVPLKMIIENISK